MSDIKHLRVFITVGCTQKHRKWDQKMGKVYYVVSYSDKTKVIDYSTRSQVTIKISLCRDIVYENESYQIFKI